MKVKIIIFGLIMTRLFLVNAQEKTFHYFGGGSIGLDYSNTLVDRDSSLNSGNKSTTFSGSPLLGYFINDKLAIGLTCEYSINNSIYPSSAFINKSTTLNYSISPLIRYYFIPGFFGQGQFIIGKFMTKYVNNNYLRLTESLSDENSLLGVGVGLGYDYKIAEKVFIEPMLRYVSSKITKGSTDVNRTNLFFSIGIITKI